MPNYHKLKEKQASQIAQKYGKEYGQIYANAYEKAFTAVKFQKLNERVLLFWDGWSTTKSWKAFLFPDSLVSPIGLSDIAFFGGALSDPHDMFKAESYKDAERKARAAATEEIYIAAVSNNIQGRELAPIAAEYQKAKTYAEQSQERHSGTYGSLLGIAGGVSAFFLLGTNPIGLAAIITSVVIAPIIGVIYDRLKDRQATNSAEAAGQIASKDAKANIVLPVAKNALTKAKAKQQTTDQINTTSFLPTPTPNNILETETKPNYPSK